MNTNEQNTAQHTPGPWHVSNLGGKLFTRLEIAQSGRGQWGICSITDTHDAPETTANARLIASAPELLEALRKVTLEASHFLHGKRDNGTFLENELKNALAAIAKATGEGKQ